MNDYAKQAAAAQDAQDRAISYGASVGGDALDERNLRIRAEAKMTVGLGHPDLVEVTRLRLLSDPGCPFWDISYCYGLLKSDADHPAGVPVRVDLGVYQLPKRGFRRTLVELAQANNVYAKGIGLLDNISTLS
ncbi:hypothetical protein [Actinophytocola sp.]|uniref:hypothetical protein n=1 Tax=Actinophytocola sp. TaxID=1872138 RepID=UPI002D4BFDF8|nr:hypothetical protein [Actinophytocola sp.]HYQ62540.1 hypothetical protein [Actinophytocola sp.]